MIKLKYKCILENFKGFKEHFRNPDTLFHNFQILFVNDKLKDIYLSINICGVITKDTQTKVPEVLPLS